MNNERYNQIIDEVYDKYKTHIQQQRDDQKIEVQRLRSQGKKVRVSLIVLLTKKEFIAKCKTNQEFSQKWGLKIEERELSLEERSKLVGNKILLLLGNKEDSYNEAGIPTKLITLTYQNETIQFYE